MKIKLIKKNFNIPSKHSDYGCLGNNINIRIIYHFLIIIIMDLFYKADFLSQIHIENFKNIAKNTRVDISQSHSNKT